MPTTTHALAASSRSLVLPAALFACLGLAGCGEGGPSRLPVSGKVSLDGKPLTTGKVTFVPLDGTTASVAEIRDGAFQADRSAGPSPGRYQVEIIAVEPTGKKVPNPDVPGSTIDEERDLVPARYNVKSELTAEVKPDADNAYEFALSSQGAVAKKIRRR
ncbi:hypothetical protein [Paludisphaera mucosa]|uniref:Carboxypeptidase regulatory-like domain-containing protein n=1 Tax=Paludisphaera mucosa TaxID=3030827 RepID=A0ABT6F513_9BACT|nr:hypothetical protein [Paludisphaera mucosa]MDG3002533.1 hypothetical protein [Paludisphaera mucosa]